MPYQYYDIRNNEHVKITYTSEQITLHFSWFFLKERLVLTPDLAYTIQIWYLNQSLTMYSCYQEKHKQKPVNFLVENICNDNNTMIQWKIKTILHCRNNTTL